MKIKKDILDRWVDNVYHVARDQKDWIRKKLSKDIGPGSWKYPGTPKKTEAGFISPDAQKDARQKELNNSNEDIVRVLKHTKRKGKK